MPKSSHREEDAVSAAMQDTLTLDSVPVIADDNVKDMVNGDDVMAELGDSQTNSDGVTKVDSALSIANDTVKDEMMTELATVNSGESQASGDGDSDEVCYYYDSKQYDKVLRDTFSAVHGGDTTDGDITNISVINPDLDQIINGHQLRMYKRTAKVLWLSTIVYVEIFAELIF